ncbi:hypothetical protein B0A67_01515 [Flavobacterium aquidurense]|nr:hypothetical protein B0A67_01515 [Flavobacterium aquidurense]
MWLFRRIRAKKKLAFCWIWQKTAVFGAERLMFGSDWPVCLLAASYAESCEIITHYFSGFSKKDQDKIWGNNAVEFFDLKD